jgi:glyoxalase family protein
MAATINGLHHVTAISGAPQRNLDFYAAVLGLRFVKRTVNFDDPSVYHLYYGNEVGAPGTAMTFFPWEHLPPARRGTGEVALTSFSVPAGSLDFWHERLSRLGVPHHEPEPMFDEEALALSDPDGLPLALVADESDARAPWITSEMDAAHALRGFHGVSLALDVGAATAELLTGVMGYERVASADRAQRYAAPHAAAARYIDIM